VEFELFHAIADEGSATARRIVVERNLEDRVEFRNVFYPEAIAALRSRGGERTPALWDGARLIEGGEAVAARLRAI
jgi:hypothetical protein